MESSVTNPASYIDNERRQSTFERRVVCPVCLSPRLQMVTGICQHRFCARCVYAENGNRRNGLERCPTCQMDASLPLKRPIIPEDVIEVQRSLGIQKCPNSTCLEEMWVREIPEHLLECRSNVESRTPRKRKRCSNPEARNGEVLSSKRMPRISSSEVGALLDSASQMLPSNRNRKVKRSCLPDVRINMRYPLRNVNR